MIQNEEYKTDSLFPINSNQYKNNYGFATLRMSSNFENSLENGNIKFKLYF